jgi:SAM-dependent methyltransferase
MNLTIFRNAALTVYSQRPDLQAAFADPSGPEYWAWCHSHGVLEVPELAHHAPAMPPGDLRRLVGYENNFLSTGAGVFLAASRLLNLNASNAILDFGCGCGRLTRFLSFYRPKCEIVGVDVEPMHIEWASYNLRSTLFGLVESAPPLPVRSNRFDTIISISIFSHLPCQAHLAWMEELYRVLEPAGVIAFTTLGPTSVEKSIDDPAWFRQLDISEADFDQAQRELKERGFSFVLQPSHPFSDYGICLTSQEWIVRQWGSRFEMLHHIPGWMDGFQDIYVFRRRMNSW